MYYSLVTHYPINKARFFVNIGSVQFQDNIYIKRFLYPETERKITLKRGYLIALLIVIMITAGTLTVSDSTNAITPQQGNVNLEIYYALNGSPVGVANNNTVTTVSYLNGIVISSQTGPDPSFTLAYGNYTVSIAPASVVTGAVGPAVATPVTKTVSVNAPTFSENILENLTPMHTVAVNLLNLTNGTTAIVSFSTTYGFSLGTFSSSKATFNASLPTGTIYAKASISGVNGIFSYEYQIASHTSSINVSMKNSNTIFGIVSAQNSATISSMNVIVLNTTTNNYVVNHFSSNAFNLYLRNFDSKVIIITASGFAPYEISSPSAGQVSPVLQPASSNISTIYTLSRDLQTLNVTTKFTINNATALPFMANATVGSLYWQEKLDGLTNSSMMSYLQGYLPLYTNSSFTLNGYNYNRTSMSVSKVYLAKHNLTAVLVAQYKNAAVSSTLYSSGLSVEIYDQGTAFVPAPLYYNYSFIYNNESVALTSSSVSTATFKSPVLINNVVSAQWVNLKLGPIKKPTFVDPYITFYWSGLTSSNYVLNTSASNTTFIVPVGKIVSINISKAYFNPVTGTNDYQNAYFQWVLNNTSPAIAAGWGDYNVSHTFSGAGTYKFTVNSTSPSGSQNLTNFTVIAFKGVPPVNFTISFNGKTHYKNTTDLKSYNITVPQNQFISFSVYNSTMNVTGTNFKLPLSYSWNMTNFTSKAANVTYSFTKPYISVGYQYAYISIQSITGQYSNLTFRVYVNDTTPPTAKVTITNLTGVKLSNPYAGVPTKFSANSSTDVYYKSVTSLRFNWKVEYANGTSPPQGSSTYTVIAGNLTNSSWVVIQFNTLNNMILSLSAKNPSNVTGYDNLTLTMLVSTPRVVITSAYVVGTPTEGSPATIWINFTNKGQATAYDVNLTILVNGNAVATFVWPILNVSQVQNESFTWTPHTSGSLTVQVMGSTGNEPSFYASLGSYTTSVSVNPAPYKTTLVIVVIVVVIVAVGIVYYRLTSGGRRKKSEAEEKKPSLIEQKKLEKKK